MATAQDLSEHGPEVLLGSPAMSAKRASVRRFIFLATFSIISVAGILLFADFMWRTAMTEIKWIILVLYAILFTHISLGFCNALFGFMSLRGNRSVGRINASIPADSDTPLAATAILFPVYNEDVSRVFAGVRATYEALRKTGQHEHFDLFILSDSTNPDRWVEEEVAWLRLCKDLNALDRIHYRRRIKNVDKKSGNVRDFLETWGARYRYMIVFDADSLMTGPTLVRLVQLMQANPGVGLIQTAPGLIGADTFYGRLQQFASRFYGRVFTSGLNYWQQSEGNYWGHNAIIRIEPFIEHCELPELPYKEPIGGKILSHDFVEAALMRRAGYAVWLVDDLEDSYEEGPPNLIDSAVRDRRWCQGNLQHSWLLFSGQLHAVNRVHFFNGIMGYAGSLFWFLFLVFSTLSVVRFERSGLTLFVSEGFTRPLGLSLAEHGTLLLAFTAVILFTPKILAWLDAVWDKQRRVRFGGFFRVTGSVLLETVTSALLAPLLMAFHSRFLVEVLLGRKSGWNAQNRDAGEGTPWVDALRAHWGQMVLGLIWSGIAWHYSTTFFWWLSPVSFALVLSPVISKITSSPHIGRSLRRHRLLQTPEEHQQPTIWSTCCREEAHLRDMLEKGPMQGAALALADPYINSLHYTLLEQNPAGAPIEAPPAELVERALSEGWDELSKDEKISLLLHPPTLRRLHHELWHRSARTLADSWRERLYAYPATNPQQLLGFV
ncbi:MAG: glucans biosynthesis glucosyltransferase MdoH [Verrucomicrobiota bacterium JB022]|nr:glucans biosynthesis glucosyltransferase MdoH [Verrucomicrobiota bacterium JB022]